jgi:hypothetical protein
VDGNKVKHPPHPGKSTTGWTGVRRVLPLVAAGLALITFVVKDAVREDLRDVVDAVSRADDLSLVRMDLAQSQTLLSNLRLELNSMEVSQAKLGPPGFQRVDDRERAFHEQMEVRESLVDSSKRLISALPREVAEQFDPQIPPIRDRLTVGWSTWKTLHDRLTSSEHVGNQPSSPPTPAEAKGVIDADQALEQVFSLAFSETQTLMKSAIKSADEVKEAEQRAYNKWTYVSWVLFGLAWVLGVIGRFTGADAAAAGD